MATGSSSPGVVTKERVQGLMEKRAVIEDEIKQLNDVLDSQSGVGMSGSLVDNEDYPRSDIDLYAVRTARHRIIVLQNDYKELMREIENGLHLLHAEDRAVALDEDKMDASDSPGQDTDTPAEGAVRPGARHELVPFARVEDICADSPAQNSGLQVDDLVLRYGSITAENFKNMQSVAAVTQHSVGKILNVTVKRGETKLHLDLTPQIWGGKGLLGCQIKPLDS